MPKKEDVIIQTLRDINQKMDRHYEATDTRLSSIEKIQVKQEENLGEHMRRTELNESAISALNSELRVVKKDDIEPLKKHKAFIEGALKGVGLLAIAVSVAAGILEIASFFMHH